jgi:hypothetical protein
MALKIVFSERLVIRAASGILTDRIGKPALRVAALRGF